MNRHAITVLHAAAFALFATAGLYSSCNAQSFPARPIRLVVAFPPGGATDLMARAIAPKTGELLGQPVIVENVGGATGLIGTQQVAKSAPDGHTILLTITGGHLMRGILEKDLPFDPVRDFTPITQLNESVFAIASNPSGGPKSLQDLIDQARRNPGGLSYGTAGLGSETHLLMEKLGQMIKAPLQVVPYKGGGPAIVDLIGGQIPLVTQPVGPFLPFLKSGKLKIIAVFTERRWDVLPEVPTVREVLPGFEKPPGGAGIWGPARLPLPIANRLQAAIAGALHTPDIEESLRTSGSPVVGSTPEVFAQDIRKAMILYQDLVKAAGIKPG